MTSFAEDWLALREPCDHVARSGVLAAKFAAAVGPAPRLIDLGCGTGSNLRYLSPRLGARQTWLCLDHDPALLRATSWQIARWADARGLAHEAPGGDLHLRGAHMGIDIHLVERDLADSRRAFGLDGVDGLTASAFLDLVSADWLDEVARRLARAGSPALFALSYDGRVEWRPPADKDGAVLERFNRHQAGDKGFGPALGPRAVAHLAARLEQAGCRVTTSPCDWRLNHADRPLLAAFLQGFMAAAAEIGHDDRLAAWSAQRRQQLERGELEVTVGHLDLLSLPD